LGGGGLGVWRLDRHLLADEDLEPPRCSSERISFGHGRLGSEHDPTGAREKARFEEQRHHVALADRLAVESLHREPFDPGLANVVDERHERGPEPALVRISKWYERTATSFDEERGSTPEQDDLGPCDACGAR